LSDGSSSGIDKCGNRFTYDAKTTVYTNENGEKRVGGEFRKRLEWPTPCKVDPGQRTDHAEPSAVLVPEENPRPPVARPVWVVTPGHTPKPTLTDRLEEETRELIEI